MSHYVDKSLLLVLPTLPLLLLSKLLQCHSILLLLLLSQLSEHDTPAKDLSSLLLQPSTRLR